MESNKNARVSKAEAGLSSSFSPFRHQVFLVLWVATVLGNTGTFMRDVASAWLVADLSASPAMVALMQTAATLPVFLLAIPAGVLADVLDRRLLLIVVQSGLAGISALLVFLSISDNISVPTLLLLTFLGGTLSALMGPAWQTIVPELVPRDELRDAVALNSLGFNISRSIGPAVGGALLAAFGAAAAYSADVLSCLFVMAALLWWRRSLPMDGGAPEKFGGALRAGLRFARASPELHRILLRAALFFGFASALWALLPLVARDLLGGSARFYGILLGAVGAGAITGALLLPRLRRRLNSDKLVLGASLGVALGMASLSSAPPQLSAPVILLVVGVAWITALTTLGSSAQAILPNWVRGRGLAIYLTVFNGAMALGSVCWGMLAEAVGVAPTLLVAAILLTAAAFVGVRYALPTGVGDVTPSNHWADPVVAEPIQGDRGPVLVTIEYLVPFESRDAFLVEVQLLSLQRRRDGAYAWGISEDAAEPSRLVEWFLVESWAEHLRQHKRVTMKDAEVQETVRRFHAGDHPPLVRHLLAADVPMPSNH